METTEVLIAGAGIIGLSAALELAGHGIQVTVLDRGDAMAESSWAAAGMLAAGDPENPPQLAELARCSIALYPAFLAKIEQLSGKKVPLRTSATLQAISPAHANLHAEELTAARLAQLEPGLQPGTRDFLLLEEQSLDPRDLCLALPRAAIAAGVDLRPNTPVLSVDAPEAAHGSDPTTSILIQTPTGTIAAAHFLNCAGAWAEAPALGRLPTGHPRIAPRKGQMVTVRLDPRETPGQPALRHVLRTPELYLVPRGDHRITVGATVEHAGFDKTVQPHAIAGLLQAAAELWPPIARAAIVESWAGLRPGSADALPLIGPTGHHHCWVAAGHFRNGILLAPGTARLLTQIILGETREAETRQIDLAPFDPARASELRPLDRPVPPASDNRATATL